MSENSKLNAAWHLSVGSRETAKDLSLQLTEQHPILAGELSWLADNFERISELLVESGAVEPFPITPGGTPLTKGTVVLNVQTGLKSVVKQDRGSSSSEQFVCDRPHGDGDFSYVCGSDWCRCCQ